MYSSRPVEGEPLFAWARRGENVEIPTHKVEIDSIVLENIETRKLGDMEEEITKGTLIVHKGQILK